MGDFRNRSQSQMGAKQGYVLDRLYKPQILRTQSKVMLDIIHDFLLADDCALCASTEGDMQWMLDLFAEACANWCSDNQHLEDGSHYQPAQGEPYVEPVITINDKKLKATGNFLILAF